MIYTYSERTVKKYTVADAVVAANIRLDGRIINTSTLDMKRVMTLKEVNECADYLVAESHYWVQ